MWNLHPVYQDELILGFQSMLDDKWSYGVRGIYRKLNNAIDDLEITSNGVLCDGEPTGVGFVMGNPGQKSDRVHRHELRRRERRVRDDRYLQGGLGDARSPTAISSASAAG